MRSNMSKGRGGFTLIELLVVIAIIAILIALLVPAVQKVRESAARTACSNNIRQLAIGVHAYHDVIKSIPHNGSRTFTNQGQSCCGFGAPRWSWIARTLPYIEQEPLFRTLGVSDTTNLVSRAELAAIIPVLICSADSSVNPRNNAANLSGNIGITNYKGVSGGNWCNGDSQHRSPAPPITPNGPFAGPVIPNDHCGITNGNGMFFRADYLRKLTLQSMPDGTSNILMIGEVIPDLDQHTAWPYNNTACGTCGVALNTFKNATGAAYGFTDWPNVYSFRSRHTGGANFAFADASVRFVSESIPLANYRAACSISGGENLAIPN